MSAPLVAKDMNTTTPTITLTYTENYPRAVDLQETQTYPTTFLIFAQA